MSRCLPFPPPRYVPNGKSGEELLELIKVQRERVKAERKKKKNKESRKKERKRGENWQEKQGYHKSHKRLRSNEWEGRRKIQGKSEHEIQESERSSLSEELEQAVLSDSLYASSDNSQSIQRKRHSKSCNECHNHGSIVQIGFQLPDPLSMIDMDEKSEMTLTESEQIASACGVPATNAQELAPSPLKVQLHHSTSQGARMDTNEKPEMSLQEIESRYREFVMNWVPPPLHFDIGDEDWLFQRKQPRSQITDTNSASYGVLHQGKFTQYPHAQYLPKANMYALPYTISY